jgi:two-component system nitrogen regulation response regulator GlnG/two-component system response regulator HydG
MSDTLTTDSSTGARTGHLELLALAVAYSRGESGRIGEVCLVPPSRSGPCFVFGRGPAVNTDEHPRLELVRCRAGVYETRPPLGAPRISRVQLVVEPHGVQWLSVRNVGRCTLLHNGKRVDAARWVPGDVAQLGKDLLLVCVRRRIAEPEVAPAHAPWAFGESDSDGFVGESQAVWELRRRIAFLANRDEHVLVSGPSGTGKELVARALHARSARSCAPFVARNAATFPESLVDAELFGHARNYPNTGMPERRGLVAEADGGTLFLDELAELPVALQTHLLRVLDAGEYQRLGDSAVRASNFRLVAATNRPAQIRDDVAARLKLTIHVPALRERIEDIPLIAVHLLRKIARTSKDLALRLFDGGDLGGEPRMTIGFMSRLLRHQYTMNVRELESLLWEALAAAPDGPLDELPMPAEPSAEVPRPRRPSTSPPPAAAVAAALAENPGSLDRAWRALGLSSRHALRRLMAKHGIRSSRS